MKGLDQLLCASPCGMGQEEKSAFYGTYLTKLTARHRVHCPLYGKLLDVLDCPPVFASPEEIPFLPVTIFKEQDLKSVPDEAVYRTLTSSGTTGQRPSRIFLDERTSWDQQRALVHIVSDYIGRQRMPMLVLDSKNVLKEQAQFSARGAGILGFSIFSSGITYALDEHMALNEAAVSEFVETNRGRPVLLFGFTYMIWQFFLNALKASGKRISLPDGILIHGGGWKKLAEQAVSEMEFRESAREWTGITRVHDYYGMVEQTGSIFMECECGHLHASIWSDVLIRRPADFSVCGAWEEGVIQVLSPLPGSYPGHSLLTEDLGVLLGEDDCPCGRKGRYFRVLGRIPRAEVRGCSDTYEG